jgi:hypothetical protein
MKRIIILLSLLISLATKSQQTNWKELNDFHSMVSEVLHPVEADNLEPIKKKSQLFLDKAVTWQRSTVPAADQYPQIEADLKKLVGECSRLNDAVKNKSSDKNIKNVAMETHMTFHSILSSIKEKH